MAPEFVYGADDRHLLEKANHDESSSVYVESTCVNMKVSDRSSSSSSISITTKENDSATNFFVADLLRFKDALEQPLKSALQSLEEVDEDLAAAVSRAVSQAMELTHRASFVIRRTQHRSMLIESKNATPTQHTLASQLNVVHEWIADVYRELDAVTNDYVFLCKFAQYLTQCVEIACDHAALSSLQRDEESARISAKLQLAQSQLGHVAGRLCASSECWQNIFSARADFSAKEKDLQLLRSAPFAGDGISQISVRFANLISGLEQICSKLS